MVTLTPRGVLLVFEGIDGAGKTTQARFLATFLREMGMDVVDSKEPTNGPWGKRLRESAESGRLSPNEELEYFIRDRQDHVQNLIEPSLAAGKVVIIDRYYFSTAAYQGARGMDFEEILRVNEHFAPQPDLLFILDVEPAVGRERIAARGDKANLFEDEDALAQSAAIFRRIERPYARHLNGTKSIAYLQNVVLHAAWAAIEPRVPQAARPHVHFSGRDLIDEANRLIADDTVPVELKAQALLERLGVRS